jgi:predicted amidophosphoribosyltransferase
MKQEICFIGALVLNKIKLEKEAMLKMLAIYCKSKHKHQAGLCEKCVELLEEVHRRLEHCRFGDNKPACGSCNINCYRGDKFKEVAAIMRYSGPRMLFYHPILTIQHLIDVKFKNKR